MATNIIVVKNIRCMYTHSIYIIIAKKSLHIYIYNYIFLYPYKNVSAQSLLNTIYTVLAVHSLRIELSRQLMTRVTDSHWIPKELNGPIHYEAMPVMCFHAEVC